MTRALTLAVIGVVLIGPIRAGLVRARWTDRTPRAAIVLWQAIGLAVCVALLGACFELASSFSSSAIERANITDFTASVAAAHPTRTMSPSEVFWFTAGLIVATLLIGGLVARAVGTSRARARQRLLIDLVATERAEIPGAVVIEHAHATAFSVPGLHARVVVSSAAVDALADDELAAVLAHEHAHLRARHDLVLFPFRALAASLPWSRSVCAVTNKVATLIEMAADDRALRQCEPVALVRALCAMSLSDHQSAKEVPSTNPMLTRVERVLAGSRNGRVATWGLACSAFAVLALPFTAMFAPLGR